MRARYELLSVEDVDKGGIQTVFKVTVERDGGEKPVCVAETVSRFFF